MSAVFLLGFIIVAVALIGLGLLEIAHWVVVLRCAARLRHDSEVN